MSSYMDIYISILKNLENYEQNSLGGSIRSNKKKSVQKKKSVHFSRRKKMISVGGVNIRGNMMNCICACLLVLFYKNPSYTSSINTSY